MMRITPFGMAICFYVAAGIALALFLLFSYAPGGGFVFLGNKFRFVTILTAAAFLVTTALGTLMLIISSKRQIRN